MITDVPDTLRRTAERVIRLRDQLAQRRSLPRSDVRWLAEVAQAAVLTLVQQAEEKAGIDDNPNR